MIKNLFSGIHNFDSIIQKNVMMFFKTKDLDMIGRNLKIYLKP